MWTKKKQYHDKEIDKMRQSHYQAESKYSTPSSRRAAQIHGDDETGKTSAKSKFANQQQQPTAEEEKSRKSKLALINNNDDFTQAMTKTEESDEEHKKQKQD